MNSNLFHDLINLDVVYYPFKLARRIATMSDKIHATKLNYFIKFFFYSIQNRHNFSINFSKTSNRTKKNNRNFLL